MAEISDLERAISRLSGFNPDDELKRTTSLDSKGSGTQSSAPTLAGGVEPYDEDSDPNIVWWDGPNDPENPMNWPKWRKYIAVAIVSSITFITPLASSMFAPGVGQLMQEFHSKNIELASFVVSIFLLGFAIGPLFLAPAIRALGNHRGPNTCGKSRCSNGIIRHGTLNGPRDRSGSRRLPSHAKGWRWVFWIISICSGFVTITTFIFLRETYAPKILEDRARKLRKETGNLKLRSKLTSTLPPLLTWLWFMVTFIFSSLRFRLSLRGNITSPTATVGLSYLGIGCGSLFGLMILGIVSDRILVSLTQRHGGTTKPEYRLPPMSWGSPLIPIGLFWYGWTAEKGVHWIVPIIGTGLVGVGLLATFMPVYAASALAATTVLRSVMYQALGLGWGNSLLGFIALVFLPMPFVFERYGERLRRRFSDEVYIR
ncbi:major facilitator superfamily domain-containing protein [Pyronema omphalodes]|nr:major facilitator superfamily domain-containing protein [Pyronema omphalodes]